MNTLKYAAVAALLIASPSAFASEAADDVTKVSEEHLVSLDAEARLDWQYVSRDEHIDRSKTGFIGKYIALKAHGQIIDGLTYTWRQRFSRTPKDDSFWDQTDILELNYQFGKFDVGAGKQVVKIGGYEYNRPPIDLICPNLFVSNIACYQYGVSGGYRISPKDYLALQITQSPYATSADRNLYSFNLQWESGRDLSSRFRFETIWSVNELQYQKGHWCNYVALGNKLVFDNKLTLLVDAMIRTYPQNGPFKNNTFMGELSWDIDPHWRVTGKVSYDCNRGKNLTTCTEVARGSQIAMGGLIAEWFPIRKQNHILEVHAAAFYSRGTNYNAADMMQNKTFYASMGLTWHMNLLNFK